MDRPRIGIVVEIFEGPASACAIVVAAGLSFAIPIVFPICRGRRGATPLGFDVDSSRKSSGELRLVTVDSATTFLTRRR